MTIVFFHAPLAGTLNTYNGHANTPSFIAQPSVRLYELIRENPQLFLWVSGHLHVPATNASYSSSVNTYEKQVTVIHNADLERKRPWTNVIYLYPGKVIVRTYDHWQKSWRSDLERTIHPPRDPDITVNMPGGEIAVAAQRGPGCRLSSNGGIGRRRVLADPRWLVIDEPQ